MSLGPCSFCGHKWSRHLRLDDNRGCKDCACTEYTDSEASLDNESDGGA